MKITFGGSGTRDKEKRERAIERLEEQCAKNYEKLFIPCFSGCAEVDSKRNFKGLKLFAPANSPLERALFRPEIRRTLEQAMEDTLLQALSVMNDEDSDDSDDLYEYPEEINLTKPDIPIFDLDSTQMARFFKDFFRILYKREGTTKYRLYAKYSENGELTKEATPFAFWDDTCEDIFPRNKYLGVGKKYQPKNLLRIK